MTWLGGAVVKNPPAMQETCRIRWFNPWVGKIPGVGNGNPLQYSCLENPMDREAWGATVQGGAESNTTKGLITHARPDLSLFFPSSIFAM